MSLPLTVIDGRPADCLDVADRGLQYGDGVFRTLRVHSGQPLWWVDQLGKLGEDCTRLGIDAPPVEAWLADLAVMPLAEGSLRFTVTRGSAPRGYSPPADTVPRRIVQYQPLPVRKLPEQGVTVRVCALRLGWQPRLAGVKHLNRLENVLAQAECADPTIHEGLLLDQAGNVIGGTRSNLFIVRDGRLLTPGLECCGVAGITRARLMRRARSEGLPVAETKVGITDLMAADEVLLTNSLIGICRVRKLGERSWPAPIMHGQLAEWIDA